MTVEAIPCAACKWWSNEPVIGEDGRTWGRCKVTGCMTDADFWCKKGGTEENLYTSDQIQDMVRRQQTRAHSSEDKGVFHTSFSPPYPPASVAAITAKYAARAY